MTKVSSNWLLFTIYLAIYTANCIAVPIHSHSYHKDSIFSHPPPARRNQTAAAVVDARRRKGESIASCRQRSAAQTPHQSWSAGPPMAPQPHLAHRVCAWTWMKSAAQRQCETKGERCQQGIGPATRQRTDLRRMRS